MKYPELVELFLANSVSESAIARMKADIDESLSMYANRGESPAAIYLSDSSYVSIALDYLKTELEIPDSSIGLSDIQGQMPLITVTFSR